MRKSFLLMMMLSACLCVSCGQESKEDVNVVNTVESSKPTSVDTLDETNEPEATVEPEETKEPEATKEPEETKEPEVTKEPEATKAPEKAPDVSGKEGVGIEHIINEDAPLIVIDPGHQRHGNSDKEPVGPGSSTMKAKVSSGTAGKWSGLAEYQVNLMVSIKLRDALLAEGYNVIMIRETHDVDISNAERAVIANEANADVFIRVHINSWTDESSEGILTVSPNATNQYCGEIYKDSKYLSDCVLKGMVDATGAKNRGVMETDTMSGINWCEVPVTIVEMGFMSNKEEDLLLATDDYQNKLVDGMVWGIEKYFGE